jgi:hypothetical protein
MEDSMIGRFVIAGAVLTSAWAAQGCNNGSGPSDSDDQDYDPEIPAAWTALVENPYFPLIPGTTFHYEGQTDEGTETITVEVLSETRIVNGVTATVVRDRVFLDGALIEDTYDWFAQDSDGNVWYLGEDSKEIEDGEVVSTEGSWEWGVDGALPGIIMWADPAAHMGEVYRQEFYEDEAEDWGKVVAVDQDVTVPYGDVAGCVKIEEWNGLEPGSSEHKYFGPTIGTVLEVAGGGERVELLSITGPK